MTEIKAIPQRTERGIPLLRAIWDEIQAEQAADRKPWDQRYWAVITDDTAPDVIDYIKANQVLPWDCGTACCLAGHAVFAAGAKLSLSSINYMLSELDYGEQGTTDYVIDPDGNNRSISTWAAELLGLDYEQKDALFSENRTAEEIELCVSALERDPAANLWDILNELWRTQKAESTS